MRCGKAHWNRNKRLPPGSGWLISIHLDVEEIWPCLHQAQKKDQGPEILFIGPVHTKA